MRSCFGNLFFKHFFNPEEPETEQPQWNGWSVRAEDWRAGACACCDAPLLESVTPSPSVVVERLGVDEQHHAPSSAAVGRRHRRLRRGLLLRRVAPPRTDHRARHSKLRVGGLWNDTRLPGTESSASHRRQQAAAAKRSVEALAWRLLQPVNERLRRAMRPHLLPEYEMFDVV